MSKLGKMLGKGSDGEVYEILDENDYVVKYIQPKICGVENYLEYYIMLNLNHPNLVSAKEVEVNKYNLVKIVQRRAISNLCIKIKNKKTIFKQIVEGIRFLNSFNILHGDIKPSNILIFDDDVVKINDFSLCRFVDSKSTRQLYTYHFRPPEANKGNCHLKSDVFALGCTLYELYYGESYYDKRVQTKIHIPRKPNKKDKQFLDLIYNMTKPDVNSRFSIEDVCNHSFFEKLDFQKRTYVKKDSYKHLEIIQNRSNFSDIFIKKCMNEVLDLCIDYSSLDFKASLLKFNFFKFVFENDFL